MRRGSFQASAFFVALLASAVAHFFVVPRVLKSLTERPDEPMEITVLPDPSEAPASPSELEKLAKTDESEKAPPSTPTNSREPAPRQKRAPADKPEKKKEEKPPPEVAKVERKEVPKPEPPKPVAVPPPPMVEMPKQRMKMVDQNRPDEEADNPDAHYLAQKNHRVVEETRALDTNLVHDLDKPDAPRPSSQSENRMPEAGDKDHKIAELEDRKGKKNQIPRGRPTVGEGGETPDRNETKKPGKLSMRNLIPRSVEGKVEIKAREGLELSEEGPGPLPAARAGQAGERARAMAKGGHGRVKLQLDAMDYDKIVGFDTAQKERDVVARGERSHVPGHWDQMQRKLALARSSLENFVSEVRPGNQSELGTRAHPFAAYIAEMHRQIHKLWAFGFLADLDGKSPTSEYNDMTLWTQLEIVLKSDGSLVKVTIVRPSGNAAFDVAAIDTVSSSAPFPAPPAAIKSANGKVYLDWRFHRDDRQCGTFGVDPHILTTVGDNQDHDKSEVENSSRVAPPRVLQRAPRASPTTAAPASPPTESTAPSAAPPSASEMAAAPEQARDAAEGWFGAYVRGDLRWLAGWSATPFTADGQVVAKDGKAIKEVYEGLLKEAPASRKLDGVEMFTPAGIRARRGGLPPGGESDGSMVFAVGRSGTEDLVLLLKKSDQGWRVCGIAR